MFVMLAAAVAVAGGLGAGVVAEEGEAPAAMSEEERILQLGNPGPQHERLEWRLGAWAGEVTYWPFPGAAPVTAAATSTASWVLDGRWVRQEFRSEVNGKPFEGLGLLGYDRIAGQYVSMWLDSTSTGVLTLVGDCEGECRELVLAGTRVDPQTSKEYGVRQVVRRLDDDRFMVEFYDELDDGSMFKSLEIRWQRS
jgi:hypothetical protein